MSDRDRKGPVERLLSLFTDVKPGEVGVLVLLTLNIFVLMTTYYVIKPVREALILSGGGAEVKSYAAAGQALLLLGAVPLYGMLAGRLPRRPLINGVTLFFAVCLVAFFAVAQVVGGGADGAGGAGGVGGVGAVAGDSGAGGAGALAGDSGAGSAGPLWIGVAFYLWVGVFSLMIVAQFWAFANDLYTVEAGKRLFPVVAFGMSAGAVLGSFLTGRLIQVVGVYPLLIVAAVLLAASLLLTNTADRLHKRRAGGGPAPARAEGAPEEPIGRGSAFALVFRNRYLLLIAGLILLLNWVNTTGEYILGKTVAATAARLVESGNAGGLSVGAFIGRFYSDFFGVVNLLGLVIQLFLVSRIVRYLGVRAALFILPVIALGAYALLAFYPVLSVVRWAKTAENATDYSLQNTLRNVLFLPTTRVEKYKAKQAIDGFFVRIGDMLSAALVFAGTNWLAFGTRHFALVNLALVAVWLVLAGAIGLEYRRRAQERAEAGERAA